MKYRATAHILSATVQRAAESILYNATSIHFSVNSVVELLLLLHLFVITNVHYLDLL